MKMSRKKRYTWDIFWYIIGYNLFINKATDLKFCSKTDNSTIDNIG